MLAIESSYTVIATDMSTGPAGVVYNTYIHNNAHHTDSCGSYRIWCSKVGTSHAFDHQPLYADIFYTLKLGFHGPNLAAKSTWSHEISFKCSRMNLSTVFCCLDVISGPFIGFLFNEASQFIQPFPHLITVVFSLITYVNPWLIYIGRREQNPEYCWKQLV